ncbi:MAG: CDP-diacylglycerol--glycerol-3-phosphate 3-phosphatidyltransferase [Ruminococcus sp.]|nr:CDP-diacylglycerol--glycerol-3-phosphate 3-phosphatidyltransferase [Ruminococcus sp.]
MNLPNKLTLIRIILVPFFIATLLIDFPHHFIVALILFAVASITDCLDGKIARKNNLVTDLGKFLDPLADKILVMSALVCFVALGLNDCIIVIIALFREFTITSVRLMAASKGKVVAANIFGKIKTVTQIIAVIAIFVLQYALELINMGIIPLSNDIYNLLSSLFFIIGEVLLWISTFFVILSGIIYVFENKEFIIGK